MAQENNPYAYRNDASLGVATPQQTQFTYDNQGLGQVVPVQTNTGQQKVDAVNNLTTKPNVAPSGNATANNAQTTTATPQRANAFQRVGGKGMTIDQRRAAQENNNILAGQQMLNASVADNMARREAEQTNALYDQGQMATKADTPLPHETNMAQYYRQQNAQQPAWGNDSQGKGDIPGDNRSAYQKFRDDMYDEEKIRKESDKRAKIYAVGDALRHLGNLYYTSHDASPQKYGTAPATEERDRYEQGRANRDALAYKYYQADQKQKMDEADLARKAALAQDKIATNQSTRDKNAAQVAKWAQESKIQLEKFPIEMQGLAADVAYKMAHADYEGAKASEAQLNAELTAKYGEKEAQLKLANLQSQINAHNATAANSWSSKKYHDAQTAKVWKEYNEDNSKGIHGSSMGTYMPPKNISKHQKSQIITSLRREGFITDDIWKQYNTALKDEDGNTVGRKLSEEDIIAKLIEFAPVPKRARAKQILEQNGFKEIEPPKANKQKPTSISIDDM